MLDTDEIRIDSWLSEPDERSLANDVLDGLTRPFKELPPKHFYDARGSELFEQICELPEYYPTRTERSILERPRRRDRRRDRRGRAGRARLGRGREGADPARRDGARPARSTATSRSTSPSSVVARRGARSSSQEYDGLQVHGVVGDFERHLDRVPAADGGAADRRPARRHDRQLPARHPPRACCARSRALLRPDDRLLLGTDLVKDPAMIEAAYDDSEGITAEFNRNVLHVINRELDADFVPEAFEHVAFFDRRHEWVEMRLRAHAALQRADRATSTCASSSPPARSCAPRSAPSSPARGSRPTSRPPGSRSSEWYTDPDELFALSLARPR